MIDEYQGRALLDPELDAALARSTFGIGMAAATAPTIAHPLANPPATFPEGRSVIGPVAEQ